METADKYFALRKVRALLRQLNECGEWNEVILRMSDELLHLDIDREKGRRDRLAGYYDKWYRYNREDDGTAYDSGVVEAVDSGRCPENFTVIECCE